MYQIGSNGATVRRGLGFGVFQQPNAVIQRAIGNVRCFAVFAVFKTAGGGVVDNGAGDGSVLQNALCSFSGCFMWIMAIKKSLQPVL